MRGINNSIIVAIRGGGGGYRMRSSLALYETLSSECPSLSRVCASDFRAFGIKGDWEASACSPPYSC